jgi:multiple sugar transport system ATP-binding protein
MTGASVDLMGLTKRFDDFEAVKALNLSIPAGAFAVLLGPSGCGKTTTLQLIAGLETLTEGDIRFDGQSVIDVPPDKRDVAVVFQSYALYPHMSVADNMAFGLRMRGVSREQRRSSVGEAAEMLGISDLLDRRPATLSGGQRQRVALGRAIVRRPRVFLLDEPLSNVDAKLRAEMRTELRALQRELEATFIYVTHDQLEALSMADMIAVLQRGVLQDAAPPARIYSRPATRFVAEFVGSPPMTLLHGELQRIGATHAVARLGPWEATIEVSADDAGCTIGLRPEDLLLTSDGDGLAGQITSAELLGADYLVTLNTALGRLTARVPQTAPPRLGEEVRIRLSMPDALHVFGDPSGQRLSSRGVSI